LRKQEAQDRFPYVAVKILNEDFKQHPQALQALQRESAKAQDLAHPNVVTVFDFDRDGDNVFMTMEFLEGESLDKFVKRHVLQGISTDKAIDIVRSLADGLAYAHAKGVLHRDLKPSNVMIGQFGETYIVDWGLARVLGRPLALAYVEATQARDGQRLAVDIAGTSFDGLVSTAPAFDPKGTRMRADGLIRSAAQIPRSE